MLLARVLLTRRRLHLFKLDALTEISRGTHREGELGLSVDVHPKRRVIAR
jgi:hypothetical protein